GAVAFAKKSSLEGRLIAVLDPGRDRRAVSARLALPAALLAAFVVLPLAALEPTRVHAGMVRDGAKQDRLTDFSLKSQTPSTVVKRSTTGATLDDDVAWARQEAGKAGQGVWWIGWRVPASDRESGGFLSDTQGFDLEMLGRQGLL